MIITGFNYEAGSFFVPTITDLGPGPLLAISTIKHADTARPLDGLQRELQSLACTTESRIVLIGVTGGSLEGHWRVTGGSLENSESQNLGLPLSVLQSGRALDPL